MEFSDIRGITLGLDRSQRLTGLISSLVSLIDALQTIYLTLSCNKPMKKYVCKQRIACTNSSTLSHC